MGRSFPIQTTLQLLPCKYEATHAAVGDHRGVQLTVTIFSVVDIVSAGKKKVVSPAMFSVVVFPIV